MKWILPGVLLLAGTLVVPADGPSALENETIREWNAIEFPVTSARGKQALQIPPGPWQHLQSAHFVLHSTNRDIAIRTAQEAEFYLRWIRQDLGLDAADSSRKSHIFIFEAEEGWRQFVQAATLDPWTGGFFDGLDLYFHRRTGMGVLHSDRTLPHEIAHRVYFETYPASTTPLALQEGFAEFEARKLAFRYLRPRGYDVRVISKRVPRDKFLPVEKLLAAARYPQDEADVEPFYDESERLVHFLVEKHGQGSFLALLRALSGGKPFGIALLQVYAREYNSLDQLERAFAEYAILEK